MPEFPIRWLLPRAITTDVRGRETIQLQLSDEWAIECVIFEDKGYAAKMVWLITSIEIHRKNTARKILVSGELELTKKEDQVSQSSYPGFRKRFSKFIEPGSAFFEIWSDINLEAFRPNCLIEGVVKVFDIHEEQTTSLAVQESKERNQLKSLEELSQDLEQVLNPESSCFADFTIKCDGVSIPAHKNILSARSPVFAAMFANSLKESFKNEVDVTDIDVSILRARMMYMYTGKTTDLTVSSATDLLFAADKYQLQDLKEVCCCFLKDAMSFQNVWNLLVLGDMHFADLKSFAVDYICSNSNEFSVLQKTQEWIALRKERPDLAMDLLESLLNYRDEKLKR